MTPQRAIKLRCKDCNPEKSVNCTDCQLRNESFTNLKRIKKYCKEFCMNNQENEVALCPSKLCPLYIFRKGKNPNREGIGNHSVNIQKSNREIGFFHERG